jgi:hypothetical protein
MWKAIQDFLGPVPAPVFILLFVAGLTLSFIASAPTKLVEHGLRTLVRWRSKRKSVRTPRAKSQQPVVEPGNRQNQRSSKS